MYELKKKFEMYLPVSLLGPGPSLIKKKRIYRAAVSRRLRNTGLHHCVIWWWVFSSGHYKSSTQVYNPHTENTSRH